MKKYIFFSGVALLVIAAGFAGWNFYLRDKKPLQSAPDKKTTPRKYTRQERKQILLAMIDKNAEVWRERYALGGIYLQEGNFDKALEQFRVTLKLRPQMIRAYNALGMCYLNLGKNDEALKIWEKALKIDPDNASARDLIDRIGKTEKRTQKQRRLEAYLKENPDQAEDWFKLGEIYLKAKAYDRAIDALKKAAQLIPDRANYLYWLGYAYHRIRDYNRAEHVLKTARILDPQDEKIEFLLNDARAKKE